MDITIIMLIEIIKGSFSVRILGNKLNVKNDKIRLINICINKSRTLEISGVAIIQSFYDFFFILLQSFLANFVKFFNLKFIDIRNLRDFDICVLFIYVKGKEVISERIN